MSITCTVTPGHTYGANHTVDYGDLNKLGTPGVSVPDGGTLAFGAGTALLPSISILGDPDTGFYQPTVDQIAFTAGGVARLVFGADGLTGNVRANAGTSGAPSLAFATDTDTGFYLPAANTIGVAGALGLADGTAATPALAFASDTDTGLAHTAADTMVLSCGGVTVATISAAGIDATALKVNGSAVGLPGIDRTSVRFADDFTGLLTANGWGIYTSATAAMAQFSNLNPGNACGVVRMEVRSASQAARIAYPNIPTVLTAGTGYYYLTNDPCYLTPFATVGEYVEFGLKLIGTIGASTPTMRVGLGNSYGYTYTQLVSLTQYVCVEFRKAASAYFRLRALGGTTGSVTETTGVVPADGTYYRIRITRIAANKIQVTINDAIVATSASAVTFTYNLRLWAELVTIADDTGFTPYLELDYAQWECPITRN